MRVLMWDIVEIDVHHPTPTIVLAELLWITSQQSTCLVSSVISQLLAKQEQAELIAHAIDAPHITLK